MKNIIFRLSTISICLSFIATNACSMITIREELRRRSSAAAQITQPKISSSDSSSIVVEDRDSFASGTTDRDSRISLSSELDSSSASSRPLFLDVIKTRPQLKSIEATLNVEPVSLDVISSLRSNLKAFSGKPPASSSESAEKPNPYANILKKTSGPAITSSDSGGIESDSTYASLSSRKPASAPPKKTGEIQVNVPEADFSYIGATRIVRNKENK